jgi:hypothetical protein
MSGEMTDFGPRHQKRSVVPKKSVRELCAPSDGSEARRQLAERADRHVGSHNHSVHITQLWVATH